MSYNVVFNYKSVKHTHRQTNTQTDRHTDRQSDKHTHTDKQTDIQIHTPGKQRVFEESESQVSYNGSF